jgi:hypothetical protein
MNFCDFCRWKLWKTSEKCSGNGRMQAGHKNIPGEAPIFLETVNIVIVNMQEYHKYTGMSAHTGGKARMSGRYPAASDRSAEDRWNECRNAQRS